MQAERTDRTRSAAVKTAPESSDPCLCFDATTLICAL